VRAPPERGAGRVEVAEVAQRVAGAGRLDLYDVGAEVREERAGEVAGDDLADVEDAVADERARGRRRRRRGRGVGAAARGGGGGEGGAAGGRGRGHGAARGGGEREGSAHRGCWGVVRLPKPRSGRGPLAADTAKTL
jgi:hypothetical protein